MAVLTGDKTGAVTFRIHPRSDAFNEERGQLVVWRNSVDSELVSVLLTNQPVDVARGDFQSSYAALDKAELRELRDFLDALINEEA